MVKKKNFVGFVLFFSYRGFFSPHRGYVLDGQILGHALEIVAQVVCG